MAPTTVAFYAPLKPPGHPNPSGDRHLAQLLMSALQQAGFKVQLAAGLRSRDGNGNLQYQLRIKALGERWANRLIRRYQALPKSERPKLWFTYHLYHKAPDWLGPRVSSALNIPYVVAEASYAAKQIDGPWGLGLQSTVDALEHARLCLSLNPTDRPCLEARFSNLNIVDLPPFLDTAQFQFAEQSQKAVLAERWQLPPHQPWLITVAMLRPGDKTHSYQLLAEALSKLKCRDWQLLIIGDGVNREQVKGFFASLSGVHFLGQMSAQQLQPLLAASDLYLWPAVNEAFGLSMLEAQLSGTAVLAGNEGGVASILDQNRSGILVTPRDTHQFARQLDLLLDNPSRLAEMGNAARSHVLKRHSLDSAARLLRRSLEPLL
ncbi:MAG: glycosyltransferase family 4 protein [Motiliproteus sp.]